MAIFLRFFNFIIPKSVITEKFDGGLEFFKESVPNSTFQEDEYLVSVGFMGEMDVEVYKKFLIKKGLSYENNQSQDFVITASPFGPEWKVDWLEIKDYKAHYKS